MDKNKCNFIFITEKNLKIFSMIPFASASSIVIYSSLVEGEKLSIQFGFNPGGKDPRKATKFGMSSFFAVKTYAS